MKKLAFFIFFFSSLIFIISPYWNFLTKSLKISPFKTLFSLDSLEKYNNQVSFVFLGIAGSDHEGGTLSDSIIVANYNMKTHKLLTVAVPRDIWSDTLQDKINTAYAYGEAKQKNGGLKLAKAEIEAVVGFPIQYAVVVDFLKFKELIDLLEGVDIDVERSFTDKEFPIAGRENDNCNGDKEFRCRYETVSFQKGLAHMDGNTALKFVRSRHAFGSEGNDFARNKRQQKVLAAIKVRLTHYVLKLNIKNWQKLYEAFDALLTRDITNQQIAIIIKNAIFSRNFSQNEIFLSQDFFEAADLNNHNGQYTLIPKENNFIKIHKYIESELR